MCSDGCVGNLMLIYKKLLRCLAIMMQLQQHQSLSSRLKLIERRLEAAASETQYDFFVNFITNILNYLSDDCYRWELKRYGIAVPAVGIEPILMISLKWGIDISNVATLHINKDELRINYSYGVMSKMVNVIKPWTCKRSDLVNETQKSVKVDEFIEFLSQCRHFRYL